MPWMSLPGRETEAQRGEQVANITFLVGGGASSWTQDLPGAGPCTLLRPWADGGLPISSDQDLGGMV